MLTDKFGTVRERVVQWLINSKFKNKYVMVFWKSSIKVKKRRKISKKLIENPKETQGICVVWREWEQPYLLRSLLTLSIYGEVLLCYWVSISIYRYRNSIAEQYRIYTVFALLYLYVICVAISIRHLRGYIYTSFAWLYIYVIYVAISIGYISVVSNIGCAFSHYDL